ncbi:VanW family protein [Actinomadura rupiterrae]|uniref:VanW family protein n=1 Tax=Actinomadura rupiterrae TaxID=559627 RepID=UPI0020A5541C|nr:VanW family protein [Actinomadura rupiterrae]MCP2337045.1 vancomycin resistance protein YoaR [Actinomadura rupiterrae]
MALGAGYIATNGGTQALGSGLGSGSGSDQRRPADSPRARPMIAGPQDGSQKLAGYTTRFKPGEARVQNIRIGAKAIDGYVVKPGRAFSFNKVVGPRSASRGYVSAPTIVGSRLVDDLGGGICQVSATLWNAVFQAGLKITESHPHTLWMPEYPQGREAAVAWPSLDFVWRNDSAGPIRLRTEVTADTLTVSLWGTPKYQVKTVTSKRYGYTRAGTFVDASRRCVPMPGGPGFQIDVYRTLSHQGRMIRRDRFHTVYQPEPKVTCTGR